MGTQFYDNTKLLNTLDKNGEKPELFIVCSRVRGPGKTFSFTKKLINDFLDKDEKFVLFCRTMKELGNIADGMMKEMLAIEHPDMTVYEKIQMKGVFSKVYLERGIGEEVVKYHCGYVIPLNSADTIKKISSMFTDASQGYFDEFQPENNGTYLSNEVNKFLSIHGSISRGGGQSRRYFPCYFSSNTVSINNPYFVELGLTNKIQDNTKFYRGDGFVFEKCFNEGLVKTHAESPMARAFSSNKSINYRDNSWLNDDKSCICKPDNWGKSIYMCTLKDTDREYAVRNYPEVGLWYIDYNVDKNFKFVYNISLDGNLNIPFIKSSSMMKTIKDMFSQGRMRMKNGQIKNMVLSLFV